MRTLNLLRHCVVADVVAALAWIASPVAYGHHAGPSGHRSAAAGVPDGAPMSPEGKLSTLDFVYPGGTSHERVYAIVGSGGSVTRVSFASGTNVRQGDSLVVSGYASRGAINVQQQQTTGRIPIATAAAKVSVEGTLKLFHADNFEAGTSQFVWAVEQDGGAISEIEVRRTSASSATARGT